MLTFDAFPDRLKDVMTEHELAVDQILFQQGESTHSIFWVGSGQLKLVSFTEQQMITHYFVEAGESFAETALHFETYGCTAIATQPSRIIAIPKPIFLDAVRQSPALCEQYVAHLTQRFSVVKRFLELRSIRSARDRLLQYLSYQRQPNQLTVSLRRSLKSLAAELGLSPEVLSRTFAQLESDGVLSRKKGSVTFSDEWFNS